MMSSLRHNYVIPSKFWIFTKSGLSKLEKFRDVSDSKKRQINDTHRKEHYILNTNNSRYFKEFELYIACFASQTLMFKPHVSSLTITFLVY